MAQVCHQFSGGRSFSNFNGSRRIFLRLRFRAMLV
jgi:hypothetical protein